MAAINLKKNLLALISVRIPLDTLPTNEKLKFDSNNNDWNSNYSESTQNKNNNEYKYDYNNASNDNDNSSSNIINKKKLFNNNDNGKNYH